MSVKGVTNFPKQLAKQGMVHQMIASINLGQILRRYKIDLAQNKKYKPMFLHNLITEVIDYIIF